MMRRLQKIFTIIGIMVAALCVTNVTVKADMIYNTEGVLIDTYNFSKLTNVEDGSYKIVSSEAGTISYYDANGNLLKIVDKNTEEILFTVNADGTLAKAEPTTEAETTKVEETTTAEKITLPKVKKLSKKTKWSKYKGVKAVKKDKNKTPIWGKIKYRYGITVSWKRVKGVTGYEIYRYENAAKKWTKIKTVKKNKKKPSYTLTDMLKGENVKIKVRAYKNTKSGKVYGEYSKVLKFKTKDLYTKIYKNARYKKFYSKFGSQDSFVIQNKYRKAAGVKPLIWNDKLYKVAMQRAKEADKIFSHFDRPQGGTFYHTFEECLGEKNFDNIGGMMAVSENLHTGAGDEVNKPIKNWYNTQYWESGTTHYDNMIKKEWKYGAIAAYNGTCQASYTTNIQ